MFGGLHSLRPQLQHRNGIRRKLACETGAQAVRLLRTRKRPLLGWSIELVSSRLLPTSDTIFAFGFNFWRAADLDLDHFRGSGGVDELQIN